MLCILQARFSASCAADPADGKGCAACYDDLDAAFENAAAVSGKVVLVWSTDLRCVFVRGGSGCGLVCVCVCVCVCVWEDICTAPLNV